MYTDYDVIIAGSGVAGLAAGIYCARAGLNTVVMEKEKMGGELVNRQMIENYPGFAEGLMGPELAAAMLEQAGNAGVEFESAEITEIKAKNGIVMVSTEDDTLTCKGVIIATGSHPRLLNVPGEKELFGKGVIYCATCDGPTIAGRHVVVAGAGDSGVTEALYLEKLGCKVTIMEFMDVPKASQVLLDRVEESDNIEIMCGVAITGITGTDWVDGVDYKVKATGEEGHIEVGGILVRIGIIPNTEFLSDTLTLEPNGQIPVDWTMATELPGVYAAGDIRKWSCQQLTTAAGDGVTAAMNLIRYINAQ